MAGKPRITVLKLARSVLAGSTAGDLMEGVVRVEEGVEIVGMVDPVLFLPSDEVFPLGGFHADDDHCDVVDTAGRVGGVDQPRHNSLRVGLAERGQLPARRPHRPGRR